MVARRIGAAVRLVDAPQACTPPGAPGETANGPAACWTCHWRRRPRSVSVRTRSPLPIGLDKLAHCDVPAEGHGMAPAYSGQLEGRVHRPPLGLRDRSASIWAMAFSSAWASQDPASLTTLLGGHPRRRCGCAPSGDHTVRIDHDRADRDGAGDVGRPGLAEGATPVLR